MKKQTLKEISEEKQQELVQPTLEAIQNANKSIIGCVYKMDYPLLVNALCVDTKKIPVTLFVEKSPYQHEGSDRAQTNIDFLQKNGIAVLTEINGYPQAQLHTKFLVIDDKVAFFSTQNGIQNLL